jgi:hypothetical protein
LEVALAWEVIQTNLDQKVENRNSLIENESTKKQRHISEIDKEINIKKLYLEIKYHQPSLIIL